MRPSNEQLRARLRASIGKSATAARLAQGLTRSEVAARMGRSSTYYGRVENGKALPGVATVIQLSAALGISVDELLDPASLDDASELDSDPELAGIVARLQGNPELCGVVMALIKAAEDE